MDCVNFFKDKWISLIWALEYTPRDLKKDVNGRLYHSFLFLKSGQYKITYAGGQINAKDGDLLFFQKGSVHSTELLSDSAECIQVEFEINNYELTGEKRPVLLTANDEMRELLKKIVCLYEKSEPTSFIEALACLHKLFAGSLDQLIHFSVQNSRIRPAVQFIEQNLSTPIDVEKLALLCAMSASQLRRLFKKEYQVTPVAFRNNLRMDQAKFMLYYGYRNISETSRALGFDNVYAFSNMFKKHTGISPTEFIKKRPFINSSAK